MRRRRRARRQRRLPNFYSTGNSQQPKLKNPKLFSSQALAARGGWKRFAARVCAHTTHTEFCARRRPPPRSSSGVASRANVCVCVCARQRRAAARPPPSPPPPRSSLSSQAPVSAPCSCDTDLWGVGCFVLKKWVEFVLRFFGWGVRTCWGVEVRASGEAGRRAEGLARGAELAGEAFHTATVRGAQKETRAERDRRVRARGRKRACTLTRSEWRAHETQPAPKDDFQRLISSIGIGVSSERPAKALASAVR